MLFVSVGTALAAAPGVLYGDPTNVTQSGAILQGSINPSDRTTTYYFEYGTSTAYDAVTAQTTLPKSKAWQAVSAEITGLSAGLTYHFRIVAWNGGGTKDKTVGSDHTFTTASPDDQYSTPLPRRRMFPNAAAPSRTTAAMRVHQTDSGRRSARA